MEECLAATCGILSSPWSQATEVDGTMSTLTVRAAQSSGGTALLNSYHPCSSESNTQQTHTDLPPDTDTRRSILLRDAEGLLSIG